MPTTPKVSCNRKVQELPEKNRKNRLTKKASSFHGKIPAEMRETVIHRPKTVPDLLSGRSLAGVTLPDVKPKLTKLLLKVTVQGSVGPVQVLMSPELTVGDLIAAVVRQYVKEGRRPTLSDEASRFGLHYSQFSLESLEREEKLMNLGSRNFFLCTKKVLTEVGSETGSSGSSCVATTSSSSCSKEVVKDNKTGFAWLKFMDFLK